MDGGNAIGLSGTILGHAAMPARMQVFRICQEYTSVYIRNPREDIARRFMPLIVACSR